MCIRIPAGPGQVGQVGVGSRGTRGTPWNAGRAFAVAARSSVHPEIRYESVLRTLVVVERAVFQKENAIVLTQQQRRECVFVCVCVCCVKRCVVFRWMTPRGHAAATTTTRKLFKWSPSVRMSHRNSPRSPVMNPDNVFRWTSNRRSSYSINFMKTILLLLKAPMKFSSARYLSIYLHNQPPAQ